MSQDVTHIEDVYRVELIKDAYQRQNWMNMLIGDETKRGLGEQ